MLVREPMKRHAPGRRPMSSESRAGFGAAVVLLALVSVVELADGTEPNYLGLFAAAPFLAAVLASWRAVLAVGAVAALLGTFFAVAAPSFGIATAVNVGGVILATAIASAVAWLRQRQAERIDELPGWRRWPSRRCCVRSGRRSARSPSPAGTSRPAQPRTSAATSTRRWTRRTVFG